MEACEIGGSKLFATLLADQRLGRPRLKLGNLSLGLGVIVRIVLGFPGSFGLDILERLVLVVLEPLQRALD